MGSSRRSFVDVVTDVEEDEQQSFQSQHQQQQQQQSCVSEDSSFKPPARKNMNIDKEVEEGNMEEDESHKFGGEEEQPLEDAKPIGDPIRVSGEGRKRIYHYKAFEFDKNQYELEDFVLMAPDKIDDKPYVAVIKDITQGKEGSLMLTAQWFYRPRDVERDRGGRLESRDLRELFYSFHTDEVSAESVMHKCVVHFVPLHKELPKRTEHPGFIVQRVYDYVEERLYKITDRDYEDKKQNEIDLLLHKTRSLLGDLPDIVNEEAPAGQEQDSDISKEEEKTSMPDQHLRATMSGNASEFYRVLEKFKALTGENHRDKWLERLLQGVQYMCNSDNNIKRGIKGKGCLGTGIENQETSQGGYESFTWPDAAVPAVAALEEASHDAFSLDFQKYNQKLRQLLFNLKINPLLTRRLLNGELEPKKILKMSPDELKEGLTSEEIVKNSVKGKPDESNSMQMIDTRCSWCMASKVGLRDIIQAGNRERYGLECIACGYFWFASRDEGLYGKC
ncbi:bromo-adjacent-likey (BAH) domain-containing protein [Quillaja saponaria]|uniref:Bromo-adjacent-likey (BAH) domain-containing protein n=1 Tax=Quillaja saponaria TaxID=32244 RepID=A0AAD7LU60_QUISA|nr:bromo-adjacent-likey (BAH) domain-containing protein [Quillaja saponaria]